MASKPATGRHIADDPFSLEQLPASPLPRAALAAARPVLSWLLRLHELRRLYAKTRHGSGSRSFEQRALDVLEIRTSAGRTATAIPKSGPLIIVANHPHGVLDGLVVAALARSVRPDVRVLTNHVLDRIPELRDLCFFVDPFAGRDAAARSLAGLRAAHLWLRRGGVLIAFPAGEVAHARDDEGPIDSLWRPTAIELAASTGARVMPAFIAGANTKLFYAAGQVHSSLRTLLLARELLNARGRSIQVRFGEPVDPRQGAGAIRAAVDALRYETCAERVRLEADATCGHAPSVASDVRRTAICSEIAGLAPDRRLLSSGAFDVFCAAAGEIPSALNEIGRLREITYRAVGEGTGLSHDTDQFDAEYLHLFSWDRRERRVVGAYRVGRTDRLVASRGVDALYTRTLFRYDARLIGRLSPALELGRSFVRQEYQRNHNALLVLWQGIGRFIVRHPEYRVLFGPVSISARYSDFSHQLLIAFLRQNHLDHGLSQLVEAINPAGSKPAAPVPLPSTIEEANRLISRTEKDGKGVPVLLRHYLKLNSRLIAFNIDPKFGDALDALMMVELPKVDRAILNRYLGRADADRYLAIHRRATSSDGVAA